MLRATRLGPYGLALAAALLFGASTPIAKLLLERLDPFTLAGLLYLGAALAVLPASFRGSSAALRRQPREIRLLAGAVLVGGVVGPVLLLLGLRAAPAATVSLWLNLESVATAALAGLFFREHLGGRTWLAVALVVGGGALLAAPGSPGGAVAALLVALACVAWGLDNHWTALIGGYTPAQTTLAKGLAGGSVNLAIGLALEGGPPAGAVVVLPALAVGGLAYGVSIALYIRSAQLLGATRSQLVFASAPFLGVVLSWLLLSEPVLVAQLAAGALMALGIGLLLAARHEHEHTHEPTFHTHAHRHDDGHHDHPHPGLPAWVRHTHPHVHERRTHTHPHEPDLHHRHRHEKRRRSERRREEPVEETGR